MMKNLSYILLFLFSIIGYGQESYVFKHGIKPNKTYFIQNKTSSYIEMQFESDEKTLEMLENEGIQPPIIMESEMTNSTEIVTGSSDKNGWFPAILTYGKAITKMIIDGEEEINEEPYSGLKILGEYDAENKFKIDSIIGENVTEAMENSLTSVFESVQNVIDFPDEPMKIGDSFSNNIPMSIPMEGMNPILININTEYLLTEVKEGKAYFNIQHTVSLDMDLEQFNMSAYGVGAGSMVFDLNENYYIEFLSETPINTISTMDEDITIKMQMNTINEQYVVIK